MEETHHIMETKKNELIHSIHVRKARMFEAFYKQGDPSNFIYYILDGEVEVSKVYHNEIFQEGE